MPRRNMRRRNGTVGLVLLGMVAGMTGLSFAAVPLYDLFCRVTGYGGTTQRAEAAPAETGEKMVTIRFDANVNPKLPWRFRPEQREVTLKVGEQGLAFYTARNMAARPVMGVSTFNVTPAKVGRYFNKVQCFCFIEQTLAPGESVEMPVAFFVDPAIADDPATRDVKTITLSYTFFRSLDDLPVDGDEVAQAGVRPDNARPESPGAGD